MMPSQVNIMEYVRTLEGKVRVLQAAQGRSNLKVFVIGFAWGAGIAALACWYILRHGG